MKRLEFDKLSVQKQIIEFNKMYETCKSIRKVCSEIGISKTTIRDRFNKIGYHSIDGVGYVKDTNIPIKNETSLDELISENKQYSNSNILVLDKELEEKINALVKKQVHEELEKHFKNSDLEKNSTEIVIDDKCQGDIVYASYGVYKDISTEFNSYVKSHKRYSKAELTSQALLEFMENHK
jgi:hypothetical protein